MSNKEVFLDSDEIGLILNMIRPVQDVPEGLDPTFYRTLSYEGDLKIKAIADGLEEKITA